MGYIYLRTNKINGKKYVGQATDLKKRQSDWNCLTQPYAGKAINNARAKYGIDTFDFEILKECKDEELNKWEKYYIKELNTKAPYGYNLTEGGDGVYGFHHSEETRKKMSKVRKGMTPWIKGKHHSEDSKIKLSEAHKGKKKPPRSEETKIKLSEAHKGKLLTEEHKSKISDALKNHTVSEETKRKICENQINGKLSKSVFQIEIKTDKVIGVFQSTMEVQRQLGYVNTNISACCRGKLKTAYGFKWKYAV